MTRIAALIARTSTRWWWVVASAWVGVAAVLWLLAPPFQSVATFDASSFLNEDAGPIQGGRMLAEGWPDDAFTSNAAIVLARDDGSLTDDDRTFAQDLVDWLRSDDAPEAFGGVTTHLDEPGLAATFVAEDGQAMFLLVGVESPYSPPAAEGVEATRAHIAQMQIPPGLEVLVGGTAGVAADESAAIDTSISRTHVLTLVLVALILLWVYRSPVAPLVPLATIGVAFLTSISVVSLLAGAGMEVFYLYEQFAIVIVFGAGTDYCLFLISRYHEELRLGGRRGLPDTPAVRHGTLTVTVLVLVAVLGSSALTTIAGFGAMSTASFGMYRSMGPAMVISVAVTLLAAVTLAPALMRLFGRFLFWPDRGRAAGDHGAGNEPLVLRRGDEVGLEVDPPVGVR
jgi:putative drug exporter of the RND superfamily